MTQGPLTETPSNDPPAEDMQQRVDDAIHEAIANMREIPNEYHKAVSALDGFLGAADEERGQKSNWLKILAFAITTVCSGGAAALAAGIAAVAVREMAKKTMERVGAEVASLVTDGETSTTWADVKHRLMTELSRQSNVILDGWTPSIVRSRVETTSRPDKTASQLAEASRRLRNSAHRDFYRTVLVEYAKSGSDAAAGASHATLNVRVDFPADGGFEISGASIDGGTESFIRGLNAKVANGTDAAKALRLHEFLASDGFAVAVDDGRGRPYRWESTGGIVTDDAHLLHHGVNRWSSASLGPGVPPFVSAHRFLWEVLGKKTFAELGVEAS
jgi:hypothetical protein